MKVASYLALAVFLTLFFFNQRLLAQPPARDQEQERPIIESLQNIAPNAVESFTAGTLALDSADYPNAEAKFKEVLKQAPEFEPAMRRLGYVYISTGRRTEGLDMTAKALAKNRSVDNLAGRASSLMSSDDPQFRPSTNEINEALALAKEAWQKSGETDEQSAVIVSETLLMLNRMDEYDKFASALKQKFPDSPMAAYYSAIALANAGSFDAAEAEVNRAQSLGAPKESLQPLLTAINTARDESYFGLGGYLKYGYIVIGLVAAWLVGLAAIFIGGRILSAKTLQSIETSDPNDVSGTGQAGLRRLYRRVISAAGIYYYISQPFVIFLVIAATLGIGLFFLWVGTIPIKLLLVVAFIGLSAIFYMIKSLVSRVTLDDPGRALSESEAPKLWALVRDVATALQTRPVNEIRITHGADLAVYERGSFRSKMSDNAERVLIIGTAVLNGFDQNAFRAVLAHEYGHFSNRDTAGGDIALRVNVDIGRVAESMMMSGTATFYNLGFQFLRLFHFLFRRITHGATRLQEILADRVAAYHYGQAAFREGLNHVIRRELEFGRVADKEITAALGANRAMQNLYEISLQEETEKFEIDQELQKVIDSPTSDDDTHPRPKDRFRYIDGIRSKEVEPLNGQVWDLFTDRAAITLEMNGLIEQLVRPGRQSSNDGILGIG